MDATVDKLVKVYIKMRDHRSKLKSEYEEQDNIVKDQMGMIEAQLLDLCKEAGLDGLRTAHGAVIRSVQTRYWTSDWEAMHKFIMAHNAPDLLERRISQTQMKEFIATHPDEMPVGMNVDSRYTITVRRSKA